MSLLKRDNLFPGKYALLFSARLLEQKNWHLNITEYILSLEYRKGIEKSCLSRLGPHEISCTSQEKRFDL